MQEVLGRAYWEQMMARAEAADAIAAPPSSSSAPDETDLAPSKPASSSSLPAFASAAAKGAKLLDEFATFSRALERDTQGLRTLEQLRAESDTTRANARNAAAAAQDLAQPAPLRSQSTGPPQPSPSPTFNPSSAPSAVTSLLDLASAARTPPQGSSALTGADKTGPLGGFSLDSGSSPAAAAASASPSLPFHGNGLTMITSIVCSCIQNVRYPITKLTALELLAEFGQYVDDEVRLGRLVPYAVALLADPSSMVRATSCHILTKLLSQTQAIHSASDAHLFAEYILPALSRFTHDPEETVRLAYAQNIAELAASSKRFLDLAQTARQVAARQAAITAEALAAAGGGAAAVSTINSPTSPMTSPVSSPNATAAATAAAAAAAAAPLAPFDATYQQELALLQDTVLKLIIDMLTIGGSRVKRALLGDITRLCIFMGRARVNNDLLPHLITVLNDRDWQLRSAFFEYIVGISVFVGKIAFNNFVLPCIEQSLTDIEEFVTQRAVHALTALSTLGLFEKRTVVEIAHKVAPLLCHPSAWIRHETIKLVASMAAALGPAKSHVFLVPLFRPFLREPPALGGGGAAARIVSLTQESLVQNLKPHLTREEFRIAVQTKADEAAEANQQAGQAPAAAAAAAAAASKPSSSAAASGTAKTRLADIPEPDAASASSLSLSSSGSEGGSNGSNGTDASSSSSAMRKAAGSSGFAEDPALFAVMNAYLGRVSQAVRRQAGGAQSPSGSASQSGLLGQPVNTSLDHLPAAGAASLLLRGGGSSDDGSSSMMDDDSFLIELQNLTLSTTLEEQIPLHQLDIERTMPEVLVVGPNGRDGSGYNPTQDAFEAGGGGGGAAGGNNAGSQQSGGGRLADPSLVPSQSARVVSGAASGANTAGATAQGGHPVPIKESLSMTPSYVIKALGVPLPPPQLGALRPDWISYSSFYQNHPVLDANSYAYSDSQDPRAWRPKGVLVATLAEHKAAVTSLAVARDNLFLASGGDEGIVKIWDAGRLKLTAHARSQLSYAQHGRITSLTVCDSSHSVASASSNGSVHVFKVEYASAPSDSAGPDGSSAPVGAPSSQRYLGLSEVRRVDPDPVSGEGSVLSVAHFNTLSESMLVYATQKAVHGWDLRSKKDVFELRLEPSMGVLTALSLGPTPYALVTGTARGFISVWDLRFQIPVQVWRHSAKTAITSLTSVDAPSILPREIGANGQPAGWMHPVTGPLVFAAAEGTNQISGFDIYTGENRMLFRVLNSLDPSGSGGGAASGAHARKESLALNAGASLNSSAAAATVKSRQKVQVSPLSLPSLRSYIREGGSAERGSASKSANAAATAYSACSGFYQSLLGNTLDESFLREFSRMGSPDGLASAASTAAAASASAAAAASSTPASIRSFLMCKEAFAMTAGTDKLVRYWDMREPADSYRYATNTRKTHNNNTTAAAAGERGIVNSSERCAAPRRGLPRSLFSPCCCCCCFVFCFCLFVSLCVWSCPACAVLVAVRQCVRCGSESQRSSALQLAIREHHRRARGGAVKPSGTHGSGGRRRRRRAQRRVRCVRVVVVAVVVAQVQVCDGSQDVRSDGSEHGAHGGDSGHEGAGVPAENDRHGRARWSHQNLDLTRHNRTDTHDDRIVTRPHSLVDASHILHPAFELDRARGFDWLCLFCAMVSPHADRCGRIVCLCAVSACLCCVFVCCVFGWSCSCCPRGVVCSASGARRGGDGCFQMAGGRHKPAAAPQPQAHAASSLRIRAQQGPHASGSAARCTVAHPARWLAPPPTKGSPCAALRQKAARSRPALRAAPHRSPGAGRHAAHAQHTRRNGTATHATHSTATHTRTQHAASRHGTRRRPCQRRRRRRAQLAAAAPPAHGARCLVVVVFVSLPSSSLRS